MKVCGGKNLEPLTYRAMVINVMDSPAPPFVCVVYMSVYYVYACLLYLHEFLCKDLPTILRALKLWLSNTQVEI